MQKNNQFFIGKNFLRNLFSLFSFAFLLLLFIFLSLRTSYAVCEDDCLKKNKKVDIKKEVVKTLKMDDYMPVPVGPISNIL